MLNSILENSDQGETPKLAPITEAGSGSVQEQQKVYMAELIDKLNDLFGSETSEQDQLGYVNGTILGHHRNRWHG